MKRSILAATAAVALAAGGYGLVAAGASIVDIGVQPESGGPCLSGYSRNLVNSQGELFACVGDQWAAQTGVAGPGETGPAGANGTTGPAGPTGPAGAAGATGSAGAAGATGAQGVVGPTGPQGIAGNDGATGADGITGATGATGSVGAITYVTGSASFANGSMGVATAYCPDGQRAIGGAFSLNGAAGLEVFDNRPTSTFAGWSTHVWNGTGMTASVTTFAYCADVTINDLTVL
ncbi:MAG: hypothetical protein ACKO2C_09335 [Actinomycetes bacterium]